MKKDSRLVRESRKESRYGVKPDSKIYRTYVKIPERELVCAEGCTEPFAPACCAAKARSEPGRLQKTRPDSCRD